MRRLLLIVVLACGCEERIEDAVARTEAETADEIVEGARAAGSEADIRPEEGAVYERTLDRSPRTEWDDDIIEVLREPDRAAMDASYECAGALLDQHLASTARADLARPRAELSGFQSGERGAIQADVMSALMGETRAGHGCSCDDRASSACRALVRSAASGSSAQR